MNPYTFCGYCALLVMAVGIVLLLVWDALNRNRHRKESKQLFEILERRIIPQVKNKLVEAIKDEMDIIPGKLKEIKMEMEDENGI